MIRFSRVTNLMSDEFSFKTREKSLSEIEGGHCEVLVIGGGISGAGVANLLSDRGIDTVLAEKGDFASGTSSGSSKLIHGGLRYLAQGEIREVRDLLKERNYLIHHTDFVKPLNFHIIVDDYSWKKYTLRFGLFLYNLLSGKFNIPRFTGNKGEYPPSVKGYFQYMDAYTDDSLLVIHNIVSAQRNGARCFNYLEVVNLMQSGNSYTVSLKDTLTGKVTSMTADLVVNAAGPWASEMLNSFNIQLDRPLQLSKGIHLVVSSNRIPVKHAIAFRSHIDKRQMFIIPRDKVVHIGTTDTFVTDPNDFKISEEDIEYIIDSVRSLFPQLGRMDVISAFAGLRPLFGSGNDPGKVSRDFEIINTGKIVSLLGGKITNYRSASRKAGDRILGLLGKDMNTAGLPVISYRRSENGESIRDIIHHECPVTLEDIMRRRMAYRIYEPDQGKFLEAHVIEEMKKEGMVII